MTLSREQLDTMVEQLVEQHGEEQVVEHLWKLFPKSKLNDFWRVHSWIENAAVRLERRKTQ
jgi:hypothetical protein